MCIRDRLKLRDEEGKLYYSLSEHVLSSLDPTVKDSVKSVSRAQFMPVSYTHLTAQSWDNQVDFKPLLEADPEVTSRLTQEEIDESFNPVYYTKRVDESSNASVWVTNLKNSKKAG